MPVEDHPSIQSEVFSSGKETHGSLPESIANRVRTMIRDGNLPPGSRLPNEHELAVALGVSRGTLRASLSLLEAQGWIWRRQGIGSFVSEKPILRNRLDINTGVTDVIRSMGLKPGSKLLEVKEVRADDEVAQHLQCPEQTALVYIKRHRTADSRTVVVSIDMFLADLLQRGRTPMRLEELRGSLERLSSLYRVFEEELDTTIDHGVATLRPLQVDAALLKETGLKLAVGSTVLYLEQVDYDRNQRPIIFSLEYHVPDFCEFTVFRRR